MVTKFSTKKRDLEHYGLSDVCIVFFKSKTEKSKKDIYKCPFSKNPKYFWKKRFTSFTSASAPSLLLLNIHTLSYPPNLTSSYR